MTGPVVGLAVHLARTNQRLRADLTVAEREVDRLRNELVVQKARVRRWRKAAHDLATHANVPAQALVAFQAISDDWADLPETETR